MRTYYVAQGTLLTALWLSKQEGHFKKEDIYMYIYIYIYILLVHFAVTAETNLTLLKQLNSNKN